MSNPGILIVDTVFGVVIFLFLIRLLLQVTRSDFYNPISQAVVRFTAFLDPLRTALGARAGIDLATLLALILLQMVQLGLVYWMKTGMFPGPVSLLGFGGLELLHLFFQVAFWGVIASIVLSWIAPSGPNPAAQLLWSLTEPMMRPARKLLPALGGLDFSPIIVLLVIRVLDGWALVQLQVLLSRALL